MTRLVGYVSYENKVAPPLHARGRTGELERKDTVIAE